MADALDQMFGENGMGLNDEIKIDPAASEAVVETPVAAPAVEGAVVNAEEGTKVVLAGGEEGVVDDKGHAVPLATYLDTRDKLKEATTRAETLQAKLDEREASERTPIERPDPATDPAGAQRFDHGLVQLQFLNEKMNNSERFARFEHKDAGDLVDKAKEWAIARFPGDAAYEESVMLHSDPFAKVIKDYQAEQRTTLLDKVDPEDFQRYLDAREKGEPYVPPKREATAATVAASAATAVRRQDPETPTRSIASATSAGGQGTVAVGDGEAFKSVFPK